MNLPRETEIKLIGSLEAIKAAINSSSIAPYIASSRREEIETSYFDVKDNILAKNGVVLRLRKQDEDLNIISMKWVNPESAIFERYEFEVETRDAVPQIQELGELCNRKIVELIGSEALEEKFRTVFTRESYSLDFEETLIEFSIDRGEIISADQRQNIEEIELELKQGDVNILYDTAINLIKKLHLTVEFCSKSQRGFALIDPKIRKYFYQEEVIRNAPLDSEQFVASSMFLLLRHFIHHFYHFTQKSVPEDIHQMRVVLRKLRVIFSILRKTSHNSEFDSLRAEARRIATLLGHVRDYDVLLDLIDEGPKKILIDDGGLEPLIKEIDARKEYALRGAWKIHEDRSAVLFLLKTQKIMSNPGFLSASFVEGESHNIKDFAVSILEKSDKKIRRRGQKIKKMNDVGRHQLRINLKKLRYISEFFMDAFDKKAVKAYIKQISLLQELLGAHNDLVCAEMTLRQIATSLSRQSQITVGKILGWYGHASLDKEFRLLRKWRKFSHSTPFWYIVERQTEAVDDYAGEDFAAFE